MPTIFTTLTGAIATPTSFDDLSHEAIRAWLGHLDAGRIGVPTPTTPAIEAVRAHNDALFRARARRHARIAAGLAGEIA